MLLSIVKHLAEVKVGLVCLDLSIRASVSIIILTLVDDFHSSYFLVLKLLQLSFELEVLGSGDGSLLDFSVYLVDQFIVVQRDLPDELIAF